MVKVQFEFEVGGEPVQVRAKCQDVDAYGPEGLILRVEPMDETQPDPNLDRETMEEIREEAIRLLYNKKYHDELDFKG